MSDTRKLKLYQGTQEQYDEIETKNPSAFYVTSDTRLLYKGEDLLTSAVWVTTLPSADEAIENALYVLTDASAGTIGLYGVIDGVMTLICSSNGADDKMDKVNPYSSGKFRFNGAEEDDAYTQGDYSLSMGTGCKVTGENSVAFGRNNVLSFSNSLVVGEENETKGDAQSSVINGYNNTVQIKDGYGNIINASDTTIGLKRASGNFIAGCNHNIVYSGDDLWNNNIILGDEHKITNSFLYGDTITGHQNTIINSDSQGSDISGYENTITLDGDGSYCLGNTISGCLNTANLTGANGTTILGAYNKVYTTGAYPSFIEGGNNLYSGTSSCHIEGHYNQVFSNSAHMQHIEGHSNTVATGATSLAMHTEGNTNSIQIAEGAGIHIEGNTNLVQTANGSGVHIEGNTNSIGAANGSGAHIEGSNNSIATGTGAGVHVGGYYNTVQGAGAGSTINGRCNVLFANESNEPKPCHCIGQANKVDTTGKYAFVIGNGTVVVTNNIPAATVRSNALTVDYSGNLTISGHIYENNDNTSVTVASGSTTSYTLDAVPVGRIFTFDITTTENDDYDITYSGRFIKKADTVKQIMGFYNDYEVELSFSNNTITIKNTSSTDKVYTFYLSII